MTMPQEQKPHCPPCDSASRCWMGCSDAELPMPSLVITETPSSAHTGIKHELTEDVLQHHE